ncbi:Adenosylhomocysteinase-like protein [Drosera capensis]
MDSDVGKGCATALKAAGARVITTEIDPIRALQALMEGFQVLTSEDVISEADIFVTTTRNKDIIMVDHKKKMKNNVIVSGIGHFDNEINMLGLEMYPGIKRITIKHQTDSFVMSGSFTNQVIGQLELGNEKSTGKYEKKVYVLPEHLDKKVAALHLSKLGAKLEQKETYSLPIHLIERWSKRKQTSHERVSVLAVLKFRHLFIIQPYLGFSSRPSSSRQTTASCFMGKKIEVRTKR